MTTSPTRRRPGCLRIILIAAAALLVLAILSALTGGNDDATDTTAPPPPATSVTTAVQPSLTEEQPVTDDQQRAAQIERYVLEMHGYDSPAGALIADPDGWVGFVSEYRVDGDRVYVRLQADRAELESRPERAANWLTSAVTPDVAGDLRWAIVEDATGTVVEQKSFQ